MNHLDILLVQEPWAAKLVRGTKQWELRSQPTKKRKRIAIGQTGQQVVLGEVRIVDCKLVSVRGRDGQWRPPPEGSGDWLGSLNNMSRHGVDLEKLPKNWERVYAWVMSSAIEYPVPVPYKHVKGCQSWIASSLSEAKKKRRVSWSV